MGFVGDPLFLPDATTLAALPRCTLVGSSRLLDAGVCGKRSKRTRATGLSSSMRSEPTLLSASKALAGTRFEGKKTSW